MSKKAEKTAKMISIGAAVGVAGAAAAAMVGAARHKQKADPRQKLMKDTRQVGNGISGMWNDVVSMMR